MICPVCNGEGKDPDTVTENLKGDPCPLCGGSGILANPGRFGEPDQSTIRPCEHVQLDPQDIERRRAS